MNMSKPFILRPVATSLLMLALLVAGMLSWRMLPVAALPQVDYPIIQVFTFEHAATAIKNKKNMKKLLLLLFVLNLGMVMLIILIQMETFLIKVELLF